MIVKYAKRFLVGAAVVWSGSSLGAQCFAPEKAMPTPLTPAQQRAVVLTIKDNKDVFSSDFSLMRTLKTILGTAPNRTVASVTDDEAKAMLKGLLDGFSATKFTNEDGKIDFSVTPRGGESALTPEDLLDPNSPVRMVPVALFNRIDLAPADHAHCGEYRIVYVKSGPRQGGKLVFNKRMTLIFEAALPNPDDGGDRAQCEAVWRMWKGFASNSDQKAIGARLADFYYDGGKIDTSMDFEPVVHFSHYGVRGVGQVRANAFVTDDTQLNWHLRQWEVHFDPNDPSKPPSFEARPVNETPFRGYFAADPKQAVPPPGTDAARFSALTGLFQSTFLRNSIDQLTAVDVNAAIPFPPKRTAADLIDNVGVDIDDKFYAVEADAGPPGGKAPDDPVVAIASNPALKKAIDDRLIGSKLTAACGVTSTHILNRMGAMTCGGCHQFSNNKEIAPGINWPSSGTFVHINEDGELSDLLKQRFLPFRFGLLQDLPAAPAITFAGRSSLSTLSLQRVLKSEFANNIQPTAESIKRVRSLADQVRQIDKSQPGAFVSIRKPD